MSSPTSLYGALVVIGSGPGIGVHTASLFASRGFQYVVLLSRNSQRLEEDAKTVKDAAGNEVKVDTVPIDIADTKALEKVLAEVKEKIGDTPLEAVLFNAARIGQSKFFDFAVEEMERDFRITVTALYTTAKWAMPQLESLANRQSSDQHPALLVTSGGLYKDPSPNLNSLALCKAAQFNLTTSLHKQFTPKGVHCALVVVSGFVSDDAKNCNPSNIADTFWKLYSQEKNEKGEWELSVELKDDDYERRMAQR